MGSPARIPQIVHFADYILDLQTAELRRNGTRIVLQDQPFQILATLIESPGHLVSREELIKRVWPIRYVCGFRSKLESSRRPFKGSAGRRCRPPAFRRNAASEGLSLCCSYKMFA